ncbi:MAG: tyrosine--tRNA ligase [Gemmatimonadetes bacterium]|nr:MAG: tyrosine--tRNA ligase [Gemmatimonadota bacterium]
MKTDLLEEYRWRGMLNDATEGAAEALAEAPVHAYIGFDPTSDSLHVGSLMPIMGLVHLQRAGHHPIVVVGGGTGLIGDPSGKTQERQLLTREQVDENLAGIRAQLEHFLDFDTPTNPARTVNNLDWLGELRLLDFLRDTGKHFSVNALIRKESIRRRLEDEDHGISYAEFSYALLQAYDFLALFEREGCTFQMGGSDQWGNITAGIDLIRRVHGARAYGLTYPLVTNASGTKFGKTEAGNVWLDPERTSPYRFYQFWLNTDDADALRYLRYFTLLDREQVAELEAAQAERPHERPAQRALAEDVTRRVHGEDGLARAQRATQVLFGGALDGLGADEIADIFADVPSERLERARLEGEGMGVVELLAEVGAAQSRGDARRAVEGGGVYLNNRRVASVEARVGVGDAVEGRFLVLRRGKKRYHLVELV